MVRSDTAVGTPDYISPEVLKSQGGEGNFNLLVKKRGGPIAQTISNLIFRIFYFYYYFFFNKVFMDESVIGGLLEYFFTKC